MQINAHDCQLLASLNKSKSIPVAQQFSLKAGIRFDGKNHNWIILQEYLALSFNYMSFVLKQAVNAPNSRQKELNEFDPECYSFVFNRNTIFMDAVFLANHKNLQNVLEKLEKLNPKRLETLNYSNDCTVDGLEPASKTKHLTALHISLLEGQKISVDLILFYLSKIKFKSFRVLMDIAFDLLEFKNFVKYIGSLNIQTQAMCRKNTLRIHGTHSKEIVTIKSSPSLYIDKLFWRNVAGEVSREISKNRAMRDKNSFQLFPKTVNFYSVNVTCLKIEWLLQPEGKDLLHDISQHENLDYFKVDSLRMLIEFLYYTMKVAILKVQLTLYLLDLGSWMMLAVTTHLYYLDIDANASTGELSGLESNPYSNSLLLCIVIHAFFTILQLIDIFKTIKETGKDYFKRFNSFFDFVLMLFNFLSVLNFVHLFSDNWNSRDETYEEYREETRLQRTILALGILIKFFKMAFYISLIDSLAALIDLIVRITNGIMGFGFVLLMVTIAMSSSFFLIGQNQIDFSEIDQA